MTREVIRLINQDEVRHVELGWAFLEQRAPHLSRSQLEEIEYAVRDVIENVELKGLHSIFMLEDTTDSMLIEAVRIEGALQAWVLQKICLDGQAYWIGFNETTPTGITPAYKDGRLEQCPARPR